MSSTITFKWERNSDVPFPNVWSTFLAKAPNSDEFHEYEIRDLPVEQFDEAFDLFAAAYMPTEVTALAFGITADPQEVEKYREMSRHTLKQRMSLACYDTVTNKMVGVNWLWVISREDDFGRQCEDYNLTPGMRACYDMIDHFCHDVNVFAKYGVNEYLGSNGLGVSDEYKGLGIAREILRARKAIGTAFGLKLTHSTFSSNYSQRAAKSVGFQIDVTADFHALAKAAPYLQPLASIPVAPHKFHSAQTWLF